MSVGLIFPGQGSQEVGMLKDFQDESTQFAQRLEEASAILSLDLTELVNEGPSERLNQTEITQPALLCMSVSLFEYWIAEGGESPTAMAGHSLGEYSALTAAGVFGFADAVKLVHERGKIMQRAVPVGSGSMCAVLGLTLPEVEAVCDGVSAVVAPANLNTPTQIVIAGTVAGVDEASAALKEAGARRLVPLAVSVPSHCELMASTIEGVSELLDSISFQIPSVPVFQNVDASPQTDIETIRQNLIAQLSSPVRWSDCFTNMVAFGCDQFLECGPGRALSGMARQIDRSVSASVIGTVDDFRAALDQP